MPLPKFMLPLQPLGKAAPSARRSRRLVAAAPIGGGARGALNGFVMERQEQSEWCWAAVSTSVGNFYRRQRVWTQCQVANGIVRRRVPHANCCREAEARGRPCNEPGTLDDPLILVGHYRPRVNRIVAFDTVAREIGGGRPLGVRIGWQGGGGHFVVIGGWEVSAANVAYIDVFDPLYGPLSGQLRTLVRLPMTEFATRYRNTGRWTDSFPTAPGGAVPHGLGARSTVKPTKKALKNAPLSA